MTTHASLRGRTTGSAIYDQRGRLVDEFVQCVREEGFAAASAKRVAERAGVTWGAIQYHFGDRDGLLMAVVDRGFKDLLESLRAVKPQPAARSARQNARLLIDAMWCAFTSPTSAAAIQILIATRAERGDTKSQYLSEVFETLRQLGRRYLGEGLAPRHAAVIGDLIWTTLLGAMSAQMLGVEPATTARERQILINTVTGYLERHHVSP
ncbi:TetR/AcrR family transcriptional regulator [Mycobacterium sp. DL440]|uniref:TetR/AcrR family transcriptional regulator n=1 Tax=Mycobacterium sp. DL440 TaxID=2675523 RepID=UPI001424025E|nr:TetR/AcrR family transcriptional regulator [Mycobacterium sp. DL440]